MTEIIKQVGASADDGHAIQVCNGDPGDYWDTADFAALGNVSSGDVPVDAWFRFTALDIPSGSTIDTVVLTFVSYNTYSATTVNVNIKAEKSDNPAAPTTCADLSGRTRTTAFVAWDNIGAWTDGTEYDTPDITTVIQEIYALGYLTGSKAMMIVIEDDGSTADVLRFPSSYDHVTGEAAKITINYTPPVTFIPRVTGII